MSLTAVPFGRPCPGIRLQVVSINLDPNVVYLDLYSGPDFTNADLTHAELRGVNLAGSTGNLIGTSSVFNADTMTCFQNDATFTDAILTGVTSGGITGRPASLPAGWTLMNGNLDMDAGPLQITTSSLPPGEVKTAYSTSVAAVGGNPPYRWVVLAGSLPPGLHLDKSLGTISGKPKASGIYSFSVEVTDSKNGAIPSTRNTATQALSITIIS